MGKKHAPAGCVRVSRVLNRPHANQYSGCITQCAVSSNLVIRRIVTLFYFLFFNIMIKGTNNVIFHDVIEKAMLLPFYNVF